MSKCSNKICCFVVIEVMKILVKFSFEHERYSSNFSNTYSSCIDKGELVAVFPFQ